MQRLCFSPDKLEIEDCCPQKLKSLRYVSIEREDDAFGSEEKHGIVTRRGITDTLI
jgi:hypothetical protein